MKIVIIDGSIPLAWFKWFFYLYSFVGFISLYAFSESYLDSAPWFGLVSDFFGEYLWVINISPRLNDFPNARILYTIVMFILLVPSFFYIVTGTYFVSKTSVEEINIFKFIFFVAFSILFSWLFIKILFFDGFSSVSADISRSRAMEVMLNRSKIGMSIFGAVLLDVLLFFMYAPFLSGVMVFVKYFKKPLYI